jgi:hypothetical protein
MTAPTDWRGHSAEVITRVIKSVGTADRRALRQAILEACPFDERRLHYPYRLWLDEVEKHLAWVNQGRYEPRPPAPIQSSLFEECNGGAA